jgi:hypothetical protein
VCTSSRLGDALDRSRYPTLTQLCVEESLVRKAIKKAIKKFASDKQGQKNRESLLKKLSNTVGKPKKTGYSLDLSKIESAGKTKQRDDYQASIRALYAILTSHCLCLSQNGQKGITANLRLNGCCTPGELADSVNFQLFFLDHPHHHSADGFCQWQDTQICVLRKSGIKMKIQKAAKSGVQHGEVIMIDKFCKTITNRQRGQLQLAVSDDGLILQGPGPLSQGYLLDTSSISLAELLKVAKLSPVCI